MSGLTPAGICTDFLSKNNSKEGKIMKRFIVALALVAGIVTGASAQETLIAQNKNLTFTDCAVFTNVSTRFWVISGMVGKHENPTSAQNTISLYYKNSLLTARLSQTGVAAGAAMFLNWTFYGVALAPGEMIMISNSTSAVSTNYFTLFVQESK